MTMTLPTNAEGQPEFQSVLVTLDPKLADRSDGHVVQKFVGSTQTPEGSLDALFRYYGEERVRDMESTKQILAYGFDKMSVYAYITRTGIIECCMSVELFAYISENIANNSILLTVAVINDILAEQIELVKSKQTEIPPLLLLDLTPPQE